LSNIITTKDFAISKEIEEENVGLATIPEIVVADSVSEFWELEQFYL